MKLYEIYLQDSAWLDQVQRNLIDLKHGDNPTIHALKMGELEKQIAARKSLIKKGAIGLGAATVAAGGYQLYKKLKKKPTKEGKLYEGYLQEITAAKLRLLKGKISGSTYEKALELAKAHKLNTFTPNPSHPRVKKISTAITNLKSKLYKKIDDLEALERAGKISKQELKKGKTYLFQKANNIEDQGARSIDLLGSKEQWNNRGSQYKNLLSKKSLNNPEFRPNKSYQYYKKQVEPKEKEMAIRAKRKEAWLAKQNKG